MWNMMSINCGQPEDWLQNNMNNESDYYVTPQQAIDMGLATDIGVPRIKMEVRLEVAS